METSVIAGKWDVENLEKFCVQSACCKVCQMCQVANCSCKSQTSWEMDEVSTDCQFLCNFEVIDHDTLLNLHIKFAKGY